MYKKTFGLFKQNRRNKLSVIAAFVLLLSTAFVCTPALANVLPVGTITTVAYMSLRHNPTGVNQQVLVNAWVTPNPPRWADLGLTPPTDVNDPHMIPGQSATSGIPRTGYTFVITKPDGNVFNTVVMVSDGPGSCWFTFTPDALGTWTVEFSWAGVTLTSNGSYLTNKGDQVTFTSCTTGKQQLVVQSAQIPYAPQAALPTDYWNYPIMSENRAWYTISGPYLEPTTGSARGYDSTGGRFNPYCRAPNSAHIAWMDPPASGMAGIIGGQWNQLPQYGSNKGIINVVMAGRAYFTANNFIYCLDVRSGQRLWQVPGTYSFGLIENSSAPATEGGQGLYNGQPNLVYIGANPTNTSQFTMVKWDGITGAVRFNITTPSDGVYTYFGNDLYYAYVHVRPYKVTDPFALSGFYMLKLNILGTGASLPARIVWNVSYPSMAQDVGICIYGDVLTNIHYPEYGECSGLNTTTGAILWHRFINGIEQKVSACTSANGVIFCSLNDRHFQAIDMKTGNLVWSSEQAAYPWGNFWAYGEGTAYGNVYGLSYAGVYCFNQADGKIKWNFTSGDSGEETPYGAWPFGSSDQSVVLADGKVFAPTGEHSPTLYYIGQHLFALDAYTGKEVWQIKGYYSPQAVAEDSLFATNAYDGYKYCFSRGNTTTTVSVDRASISKGSSAWITGTVMDMSPAQPNTPAVSKDSMSAWMEYLHMQQPKPTNTTGVAVTLTATASDGSITTIGSATSDADGIFHFKWTPPNDDWYKITATFAGDDSYFSSSANAILTVAPATSVSASPTTSPSASSTTTAPTPPGTAPGIDMLIVIAAVVIIVIVIAVAAVILRRRK